MLNYSTLYTLPNITSSVGFWPDLVWFKWSLPLKCIQYFVRCFLIWNCVVSCLCNKLFSYFNIGVRRSEVPSWDLLVYILGFVLKFDTWGYAYTKHEKSSSRFFVHIIDLSRNELWIFPLCTHLTQWPNTHNVWYQPLYASCGKVNICHFIDMQHTALDNRRGPFRYLIRHVISI